MSIKATNRCQKATSRCSNDFKYDGGGLHKRGTATLSITRRHVRAHDDLLRAEPQSNESGTLRVT
jgi:hypothetical protein